MIVPTRTGYPGERPDGEPAPRRATLVVVGGLPGVGKTTVARAHVRASRAAFLRVDTIEQALVEGSSLRQPLGPVGYLIGYALAAEQLRLGVDVVAECVNPLTITRDAWARTAVDSGALLIDVEIVCSDPAEHRRRVETRNSDIPGLVLPTWKQVVEREYEPWNRDRLVLDTAQLGAAECVDAIAAAVKDSAVKDGQ